MVNGLDRSKQAGPADSAPIFKGKKKGKGVTLNNFKAYQEYLETIPEGEEIQLVVRSYQKRNDAQNRYYWGVVLPLIGEWMGDYPEAAHEVLKEKFMPHGHDSTSTLSVQEFARYLEAVTVFAAQNGVVLPEEGEYE